MQDTKFLIFASFIAFILEDYGTFEFESIDELTKIKQATLFKKYALEVVAAAVPALRANNDIMEDGCQCIPIVEQQEKIDPLIAIFATFSIAKDYREDLQVIKQTSDLDTITIKDGMMENIRKILHVLNEVPENLSNIPIDQLIKDYVLNHGQGSSNVVSGSNEYDKRLETAMKCYRSVLSSGYRYSKMFFDNLHRSFLIASNLMDNDDYALVHKYPEWAQLRRITESMSQFGLITIGFDYAKKRFYKLLEGSNDSDSESE